MAGVRSALSGQNQCGIAKSILEGRFVAGDTIRVHCENGIMRFDTV
jgi:hypothetical protein